jgi:hypothetical protein
MGCRLASKSWVVIWKTTTIASAGLIEREFGLKPLLLWPAA